MSISRTNSASLDVLRACAALAVFLQHWHWTGLDGGALSLFTPKVGRTAVVVFFVLSGLVISATASRTPSFGDYAVRRAARIYSVAIPALLLTLGLDLLSLHLGLPDPPNSFELNKIHLYFPFHLMFAGELWSLGVYAFSDGPYWSINYEVWYYIAFGSAIFLRGWQRVAAVAAVVLLMGPKLWLLFPIWLGGVAVHWLLQRPALSRWLAGSIAAASAVALVLFLATGLDELAAVAGRNLVARVWQAKLRYSQDFLADYIAGALAMGFVFGLCSAKLQLPRWVTGPGQRLAAVSFSLYLVHIPLFYFFGALLPTHGLLAGIIVLIVSVLFGLIFEPQRERLRRMFNALGTPVRLPAT